MGNPRYGSFILKYLNLLVFKKKTLGKVFEQIAAQRGDEAGVIFEGQKVGYREVNRRANRRANLFRSLGVGKGDVVALVMENRLEFLETVVGLSKLGGVTALINYNLKGTALAHCINISGANRIIVGAECVQSVKDALPELERVAIEDIYVDTHWKEGAGVLKGANNLNEMLEKASGENPVSPPLGSKDLVLYIYTSGTTGLPKAARISHYRWFGAGLAFGYYGLVLDTSDTMYCPLPLYHSNGILIAFSSAVQNGANFVITRRFSASGFWKEATETGATSFIYIGELLRYLVNQEPGKYDKAHKVTRIVGNGLRPDIWPSFVERFGIKHIREFYASTEGNAYTLNLNDKEGSVGQVILKLSDNTALVRYDVDKGDYIRQPNGFLTPCQPMEVGELLAKVTFTTPFHGYSNKKETESKVLTNVYKKGDLYFRTGDLMKRDAEGNYFFVDRMGDTYRWKGENVSTQEVQEVLGGFPGVEMASVYGVAVPGAEGRVGMAAIKLEGKKALDGKAMFKYVEERLAPFARPAFIRMVEVMDMTGTFKLRKVEMQKEGFDPALVGGTLYYLDKKSGAYKKLDAKVFKKISEDPTGMV